PYDRLPYFFSDQYDVGMEYSGHAAEWDDVVLRGDPAAAARAYATAAGCADNAVTRAQLQRRARRPAL
ncbi:MAG: 3-phenylpropionate/trans-cinnamate dioxygenase ferredoxin reductase component, partial [Solirubrobacteraceae bacterium]|nr:3-phenylpropionate/trans-cinnamate dioxygenase ferredoxin reductase component [Solirubrobacteraceae bacterium]